MRLLATITVGLMMLSSSFAQEPKLTKMSYSFRTTTNDKDWDTRVGAEVVCNGHDVAQRFDFNHDKNADHWGDPSDNGPWELPISEQPTKQTLNECQYRVSAEAKCNDRWDFNAMLHADFSDGTQRNWTFLNKTLDSHDCHPVSVTLPMSNDHD